jgi:DNA-binding PadR family transcriptional regulator
MLSRELVAASAEPLILSLLQRGDSYGYAIAEEVLKLSQGKVEWTEGMLYPVLHRLEERGQICSRWEAISGQRKRRYYALTPKGREALQVRREEWQTINNLLNLTWGEI